MAIRHKRKSVASYSWQASDLVSGQVGMNTADGTLHVKKDDNSVVTIGAGVNVTVGTSAPGSPEVGDIWIDTN